MIRIKNVSMKFNMDIEKDFSIKQAFINFFTKKKKLSTKLYTSCG